MAIFTYIMYTAADDIAHGIHHEFTGRRSGIMNLIYSFGETLGVMGSLIIGGSLTIIMAIWLTKTIKSPQTQD
ncbi:hypothetical protein KW419_09515 [Vibrio fluvialis]|uniref:hypothetical protein n=1 Tax=Vibrio fluvialis TaxID=676 RepID=UPI001C9C6658|nr:hypothetical protein [Vibrio fluvialis]MBY7781692.1 hypothetical protein [Vibrio fluvialis]MBY7852823.1 hypothetical protein [Vibrio fluvialis]MBY7858493.1 hypothetical protein [Vibrio fluvialis]MBY7899614.1 hypothetical protein [Vibrio fluvialis]MBY7921897.1 hypothetical protein [Vibrio fluvialis]